MSGEAPAVLGIAALAVDGGATLHTPEGLAIDFFRVPEAQTVKNRPHLDLRDPEGNALCLLRPRS